MANHTSPSRTPLSLALASAVLVAVAGPAFAQDAPAAEAEKTAGNTDATQLDRITVTGSRIHRAGFDTLEPAAVVSREAMEAYGQTNLIDALTTVPGISAGVSSRGNQASFGAGVNFASRFGLGSNRLLTLVNGRRYVTSTPPTIFGAGGGSGIQVDMNAIPRIMVDRIENLSVGGAPSYGSEAISGVTNINLREKFQGAEVELGYGTSSKRDNDRYAWAAIFGSNFAADRGNITIAAELDNSEGVNALQRDFYRKGYSLQANPNAALAARWQPARTPGNDGRIDAGIPFNTGPRDGIADQVWIKNRRIASMSFGGLVLPNVARYTRDPLGAIAGFGPDNKLWQFDNTGKLVAFNPGTSYAGGNASGGDGLNLNETVPLIADLERRTVHANGSFEFNDTVSGFFELSRYQASARETLDQNIYNAISFGRAGVDGTGALSGALLFKANNPYLHEEARKILADNAITEFRLSRSSRDLSMNNASTDTRLTRAVIGAEGYFGIGERNFNWEASVVHGRGDFDYLGTGLIQQNFINAINVKRDGAGNIVCDSAAAGTTFDPACRPLNLFGENQASREALDYVSTNTVAKAQTRQTVFNASVTGGLFDLPGGEFAVAGGYEHRREEGSFTPSEYQRLGQGRSVPIQSAHGEYNTNEVFSEFLAPLFNPEWGLPGLHRLDITGKVRRVDNSVAGGFTAYTYGLQYEPFAGIQLRGNKTRSMRAPSIAELYTNQQPAYYNIPEVCSTAAIDGGSNPAVRRRNCEAFFAAYPNVNPSSFVASPTNTLGSSNGYTGLKNEKATSWTAGIVFAPEWLNGLRIAADWYDIEITDVITALSPNDIITGCFDNPDFNVNDVPNANRFCSLVSRDPVTAAATDIKTQFGNGPVLIFRGWTAEVDYRVEMDRFGRVDLGFYGYLPKNRGQAASAEVPFVEQAGTFNEPKRQFRWTAQHKIGDWSAGVAANYTSSAQFSLVATPESRQYFVRDSWTTWDANISYRFTDNVRLNLAAINLADNIGPFPYVLDALGRRFMLSMRYKFQ